MTPSPSSIRAVQEQLALVAEDSEQAIGEGVVCEAGGVEGVEDADQHDQRADGGNTVVDVHLRACSGAEEGRVQSTGPAAA